MLEVRAVVEVEVVVLVVVGTWLIEGGWGQGFVRTLWEEREAECAGVVEVVMWVEVVGAVVGEAGEGDETGAGGSALRGGFPLTRKSYSTTKVSGTYPTTPRSSAFHHPLSCFSINHTISSFLKLSSPSVFFS